MKETLTAVFLTALMVFFAAGSEWIVLSDKKAKKRRCEHHDKK